MDKFAKLLTNVFPKSPESDGDPCGNRTRVTTVKGQRSYSISATFKHFCHSAVNVFLRLSQGRFVVCLQTCQLMRQADSKSRPSTPSNGQNPYVQAVSSAQDSKMSGVVSKDSRTVSGKVSRGGA